MPSLAADSRGRTARGSRDSGVRPTARTFRRAAERRRPRIRLSDAGYARKREEEPQLVDPEAAASDSTRESAFSAMPLPPCVPCSRKEAAAFEWRRQWRQSGVGELRLKVEQRPSGGGGGGRAASQVRSRSGNNGISACVTNKRCSGALPRLHVWIHGGEGLEQ